MSFFRKPTPLPVQQGGTGDTNFSSGYALIGNGYGALLELTPSTTGNVMTSNGTTWTSAPPSGGGSGTVNSGTTGQIAYYASNGTAVSGETQISATNMPTGSVIQVYNLTAQTTFSTTSTSMVQGPQTATFTLNSNSNKVMVIANFGVYAYSGSALNAYVYSSIYRGSIASGTKLNIANIDGNGSVNGQYSGAAGELYQIVTLTWLDTPTASTTYSVGFAMHTGQSSAILQGYNITLMEIKA